VAAISGSFAITTLSEVANIPRVQDGNVLTERPVALDASEGANTGRAQMQGLLILLHRRQHLKAKPWSERTQVQVRSLAGSDRHVEKLLGAIGANRITLLTKCLILFDSKLSLNLAILNLTICQI
jgi:hypothetical protein